METKPFAEWIGRTTEATDIVTERLAASFRAIFDPHLAPVSDGAAPLGIHWCLAPQIAAMDELGPDGHPAKNRDLPPVPQPRRMWAGGWLETLRPLRIEDRVTRVSTIADISRKPGRSGELWFVAVDHAYLVGGSTAIRERHDIVYREAASPASRGSGEPARNLSKSTRTLGRSWIVETSATQLFRYSAITFNGHRIHYDLAYATKVEGYRGLVVHGPVQATLLLNLAAVEGGAPPRKFTYRGLSPAIAGETLSICAGAADDKDRYWAKGSSGRIYMEARADGR